MSSSVDSRMSLAEGHAAARQGTPGQHTTPHRHSPVPRFTPSGQYSPVSAGDALDYLAAHLARVLRGRTDAAPLAPIAIADLFHTLLPPRATAAELGFSDFAEYGVVLMRLLSGERGYVLADPELQHALLTELEKPSPDPGAYRAFARAPVSLSPRALDLIDESMACRCCGGRLPRAGDIRFCPSCGEDLGVKRCPACSAECDVDWRFCVRCGRGLADEE